MFDQLLKSSGYYEFPSFEVAIYSLLLAFALGVILTITYKVTYRDDKLSINFLQAMVLSPLVSAMVMMAVGGNLAVGFGIIGAIAIIRFRTMVRNPRNVIFIFAALSIGIATGAYGYAIAISGTLIFCVVAVLLFFSPLGQDRGEQFEINFTTNDPTSLDLFGSYMKELHTSIELKRIREGTETPDRYEYIVSSKKGLDRYQLFAGLKGIEGLTDVRVEKLDYSDEL